MIQLFLCAVVKNDDFQDIGAPSMGPLWYLSCDFQLFVVVVVCLALTNRYVRTAALPR